MGKKVRCVNPGISLTRDKVYQVTGTQNNSAGEACYILLGLQGKLFRQDRFVDVLPTIPITSPTAPASSGTDTTDAIDWRKWRDSSILNGYCPCGIAKVQCTFHGDNSGTK